MPVSSTEDSLPWFYPEFANAELGDARREARLLSIADVLSRHPQASIAQAHEGDKAALKATYRFFDNDEIHEEELLQPHVLASLERIKNYPLVLAPQDTTFYELTHQPGKKDIGYLATPHLKGLVVHSTLGMTPDGTPLGLLSQQVWVREMENLGKKHKRKELPIEEKESYKWLLSFEALNELSPCCPDTTLVSVGDREADVFDLFAMERESNVELLVRACRNRKVLEEEGYLWPQVESQPDRGRYELHLSQQPDRPARKAEVSLRWCTISLCPPGKRTSEKLSPVEVSAILVREELAPENVEEPVEWLLLTSMKIRSLSEAMEHIEHYERRWGIEVFHKILKSGCKIEEIQLETGARLRRALPIYSVIAWRIMYGTMLAREAPEVACRCFLEDYS